MNGTPHIFKQGQHEDLLTSNTISTST